MTKRQVAGSRTSTTMSYLGIEGKHAAVTGASGGIGQAIVLELLGKKWSPSIL